MTLDQEWEAGLRAVLRNANSRTNVRLALSDPWHRALACCITAQMIRKRRTHQGNRRTLKSREAHDERKGLRRHVCQGGETREAKTPCLEGITS